MIRISNGLKAGGGQATTISLLLDPRFNFGETVNAMPSLQHPARVAHISGYGQVADHLEEGEKHGRF